jgi:hypothetical protein
MLITGRANSVEEFLQRFRCCQIDSSPALPNRPESPSDREIEHLPLELCPVRDRFIPQINMGHLMKHGPLGYRPTAIPLGVYPDQERTFLVLTDLPETEIPVAFLKMSIVNQGFRQARLEILFVELAEDPE